MSKIPSGIANVLLLDPACTLQANDAKLTDCKVAVPPHGIIMHPDNSIKLMSPSHNIILLPSIYNKYQF